MPTLRTKHRQILKSFSFALPLGLALLMGPQIVSAQDTAANPSTTTSTNPGTDLDTHRGFDWGWLGLLGLAGLAGLRRPVDIARTTTDTRR